MSDPIRVALVNDFELIVRGLTGMLEPFQERVAVVELDVATTPSQPVDVALFDTYGHARGGLDRVRSLATDPRVGAAAVYTWARPQLLPDILAAGATAVLAKSTSASDLANALVAVHGGETVVSSSFRGRYSAAWPGREFGFTIRESEVAALLVEGLSNQRIADALCVSEHTVKSHLKSIFRKTGVSSRAQAIAGLLADTGFRHK
jgi:NarL family two-component system response regulator LiaR